MTCWLPNLEIDLLTFGNFTFNRVLRFSEKKKIPYTNSRGSLVSLKQ